MYAEAILDPGEGGRVVPGLAALDHSTNAAQPQKRLVPKGWGGIGGIAALRPRGKPVRAAQRWRALHCPQWRSHIRDSIYEFVDFTRTNRDFLSDFLPKKMTPLQEEIRRPASRARLARVAELRSPRFIGFMDELNRFARRFELQEYVDFSKNWEYPWLWFNGLQEIIRPGVKVLDIGSEMSPMPWYFASRGARVTLVEQHSHLHERWNRIRERLAVCVDWKVSHAESLPLEEGSFDVVTSLSVIEHQADKRRAINEMLRVLREGGLLGLSFDLCESKYGMSYPDWNGFPLSLDRFEQLLWNHEEVATGGFELEWNEDDIEDFLAWHRTTADHHIYVVGAGILQKRGNPMDRVRVRR